MAKSAPSASSATHLRSRGENNGSRRNCWPTVDPPPLARRELDLTALDPGERRPTSARAERTSSSASTRASPTTHLRSRGENFVAVSSARSSVDPPPLARREPSRLAGTPARRRPTSARAERTAAPRPRSRRRATHLRSRGENWPLSSLETEPHDPPPLARRERPLPRRASRPARPTSARAERTGCPAAREAGASTHLRSRGENYWHQSLGRNPNDPPPLARREPLAPPAHGRPRRPTSARAERTPVSGPAV